MMRSFVRSLIHNATVTQSDATFPAALRIDGVLLRAAEPLPHEDVRDPFVSHAFRQRPRPSPPCAHEVDETSLGVDADQLHAHLVADIESIEAVHDLSFDGRMEDAHPCSFWTGAGDDALEVLL